MRFISAVALAVLAGCSGANPSSTGSNDTPPDTVAPAPATAEEVTAALRTAGLPIVDVTVLNESTDDNQLLGRPGQYTSKVFFFDRRHPKNTTESENENTIEVFDNAVDAKRRKDYVEAMTAGMPMLAQYQYAGGLALVRLNKALLPSEAKEYEAALAKVTAR